MGSDGSTGDPAWIEPWTRGQGETRTLAFFERAWGGAADGVWSAPGRLTIIGEHTDYSGGLSLPTVTAHRTYVAARRREDSSVRIASEGAGDLAGPGETWEGRLSDIAPSSVGGWPAYVTGVLWALRERGYDGPGVDLAITSCLPADAGLGSSGAVECATALAVNALWRLALDSDDAHAELAEACIDGEEAIAQAPTGGLDQHTQLRCREGEALELDFSERPPIATHRPLYFPDYGLCLLITDVRSRGRQRTAGYVERRDQCAAAAAALGVERLRDLVGVHGARFRIEGLPDPVLRARARHVVTEVERVIDVSAQLAGTGPAHERFVDIGKQLFRSHASLEVDFEASTPELNLAVDTAFRSGALGARMVGAGFGGSTLALVRRADADAVASDIDRAFTASGRERPRFLVV
ncbi:galactokinase family protein [Demequina sp. NBRC 110056]|uniref:galactokinase n=1 Tax=Demequina sp. NBRC 110056 TaxID=1570345 RepID=UPI001356547B|nr:galactokinase family protein [Demequina sp. NBRC 110056]